jgi:hypothetical protein
VTRDPGPPEARGRRASASDIAKLKGPGNFKESRGESLAESETQASVTGCVTLRAATSDADFVGVAGGLDSEAHREKFTCPSK